jgi:hypothetical protein
MFKTITLLFLFLSLPWRAQVVLLTLGAGILALLLGVSHG